MWLPGFPRWCRVPSACVLIERDKEREGEKGRDVNNQAEPFMILQVTISSGEFCLLGEHVAETGSHSRGWNRLYF